MEQADVKPTVSPLFCAGAESMIRASVGNVAAALRAPLKNLTTRSQRQDGTKPVNTPKTMSPANPHRMSFFLPKRSDNFPIVGEKIAEDRVKAEIKTPTEATVAPNEVIYIG